MRRMLLSFFGAGYLRPAPGTWGSLAALPVAWGFHALGGAALLLVATAAALVAGIAAVRAEIKGGDDLDPSWIVIDEVVGMWISLLPLSVAASYLGAVLLGIWPTVAFAFLTFRALDIFKPWIVGRADARGDAVGVMLDDVWAGVLAAAVVTLGYAAYALLWAFF